MLDKDAQRSFMSGHNQAVRSVLRTLIAMDQNLGQFRDLLSRFEPPGDVDETIVGLNDFFATPENLGIPINRALQILAAKKAGLDEVMIQKKTEEFRREASTYK